MKKCFVDFNDAYGHTVCSGLYPEDEVPEVGETVILFQDVEDTHCLGIVQGVRKLDPDRPTQTRLSHLVDYIIIPNTWYAWDDEPPIRP